VYLCSAFGKSLCVCKSFWKWSPRASIQAWTSLVSFADTFCRSAFRKSLCTYNRFRKCSPRVSIQAWNRLILFANTSCRSAFGKSLFTYNTCWKWYPRAFIQALNPFNVIPQHCTQICVQKFAVHIQKLLEVMSTSVYREMNQFNLKEPCVLYIGRAHHYLLNTSFYIFFQQIYVLNFLNMLHTLFFLFKMLFIS
jgi:hypothetical protein